MILWSNGQGSSYLLNFPFQPPSAHIPSDKTDLQPKPFDYMACEPQIIASKPAVEATVLDMTTLFEAGAVKHVFATSGMKARPVRFDVNGKKGRRAVCVLYGDRIRYDVLGLDAAMDNDEDIEDEE